VNPYDLPGLVGGMAGTWLFLVGCFVAFGAAIWVAATLRVPGTGRFARGLTVAGVVIALAGVLLFFGAQSTGHARAFDEAAVAVSIGALVAAALAGGLVARRSARERAAAPPSGPPPGGPPAA
jgi:hypothetical protein